MKDFEKIIGYEAIKQELIQISDVLANSEAYQKLGVESPHGLLLYGSPGVGKTLMSYAVIAASGRKAFVCRKDKPNGDFVKAIKETFAAAKAAAPSIVFLDDMEKFANGDERHPHAEEYVTVQSCIDDSKGQEVFVLATANKLQSLPRSLLRAGRFDRMIKVHNPRGEDAVKIIDHYIKKKKCMADMDATVIARMMDGRSCAALETVINEAGLYAGFERSNVITMDHFMKACLHTVYDIPSAVLNGPVPKTDLTNGNDQRVRIVYHEAGHATVAEVLNPGSVALVTAYNDAGHSGGFTSYCCDHERSTTQDMFRQICASLGGMAALDQQYGMADAGVGQDLDHAFSLVSGLVGDACIRGFGFYVSECGDSQSRKSRREQAVAVEMERWYRKTKEILSANRDLFEAIAAELSQKGVLTTADIDRIKQRCRITPVAI